MYKVLGEHIFISFLRRRVAGSYGNFIFNVLKNYKLLSEMASPFQNLIRMSEGSSFPICLRTTDIVIFITIIIDFLVGVKWYLVGILIHISLTTDDGWHVFFFLLISHLCVFFGDKSTYDLCLLLN